MTPARKILMQTISDNIYKYSPIVIYGESGSGKSFFLKNLCKKLQADGIIKEYNIQYAWDFINGFIEAVSKYKTDEWHKKQLSSEIIIIDDFQFLSGKMSTQEEMLQILKTSQKPVIITTDINLSSRENILDDIKSFFDEGTRINLDFPSQKDISDFLEAKIQERNICISNDAKNWLFDREIKNFTLAKGVLKTLELSCRISEKSIELKECKNIVNSILPQNENIKKTEAITSQSVSPEECNSDVKISKYSDKIKNYIQNYLDKNDWYYSFDEKRGRFYTGVKLDCVLKKCDITICIHENYYMVYGMIALGAEKNIINNVSEYLNRANFGTRIGNFELDYSDGEIRYKICVDCGDDCDCMPSESVIERSVEFPGVMFEEYGNGLVQVIFGMMTPEEVLRTSDEN